MGSERLLCVSMSAGWVDEAAVEVDVFSVGVTFWEKESAWMSRVRRTCSGGGMFCDLAFFLCARRRQKSERRRSKIRMTRAPSAMPTIAPTGRPLL